MLYNKRTWNGIEISSKAQEKFKSFNTDKNIVEVCENSIKIKIDDDFGNKPSKALYNEKVGSVMPIRERGDRCKGITTVLNDEYCDIIGDIINCLECSCLVHTNRDHCYNCNEKVKDYERFYWKGIEITKHCQQRFEKRTKFTGDIKENLIKLIEKSEFRSIENDCMCLYHEKAGIVLPIRNRDHKEDIGIPTTLLEDMVDEIN